MHYYDLKKKKKKWKCSPHYARTIRRSVYWVFQIAICACISELPSEHWCLRPTDIDCCVDFIELCIVWVDSFCFCKGEYFISGFVLLYFYSQHICCKWVFYSLILKISSEQILDIILRDFLFVYNFNEPSVLFAFSIKICYFFNCSLLKQGVFQWIVLESGNIFFCYFK